MDSPRMGQRLRMIRRTALGRSGPIRLLCTHLVIALVNLSAQALWKLPRNCIPPVLGPGAAMLSFRATNPW